MKRQLQQGDVNIWTVPNVPKSAKKVDSNVVAEGEVTGHAHRLSGDFKLFRDEDSKSLFAEVGKKSATLTHEEHGPITLDPGKYQFGPTYEYDYETEEARRVAD